MLTVQEVARRVGLTQCAIYRAIQRGELVAYKPGGRLRIREADFEHWLESTRVPAPAPRVARPAPVASLELVTPARPSEPSLRARVKATRGGRSAA
jgi:excisionase family DNA binding protein